MWYYMLLPDTSVATVDKAAKYLKRNFPQHTDGWTYDLDIAIDRLKRAPIPTLRWGENGSFVYWGHVRRAGDTILTLPLDNIFIGEL